MKSAIYRIPGIGPALQRLYRRFVPGDPFPGSEAYWVHRYKQGGNSGDGSYAALSEFKSEVLNNFVHKHEVTSVIEFGSRDGNQLALAEYPQYLGIDVSPEAVELCERRFADDASKSFALVDDYAGQRAELSLSLDVIYHLVEDEVYSEYMHRLFDASTRFVIVYSSNKELPARELSPHVRHRRFMDWVRSHKPQWELVENIENRHPERRKGDGGSHADFYVLQRMSAGQ